MTLFIVTYDPKFIVKFFNLFRPSFNFVPVELHWLDEMIFWIPKELNLRQSDLDERIKESIKKNTDCLKDHMKSFDEERTKLIEDYEAELKPIKDEMEDLKAQEITKDSIFIKLKWVFKSLGH